jgi:hypothetical protein
MACTGDLGTGPDALALRGSDPAHSVGAICPIQLEQSRTRDMVEKTTVEQ